jgi:hypothetical protein
MKEEEEKEKKSKKEGGKKEVKKPGAKNVLPRKWTGGVCFEFVNTNFFFC